MAKQLQLRSGTTTEHNTFTGAVGEVTVDTTKDTLVVHDGVTVGGFPVASKANADGTISLIKKDGTSAGTINADGLFNNTLTSTNTNQALTAAQGKVLNDQAFGVGQTWQNMTASRSGGSTYTNNTGKPITVIVSIRDVNIFSGVLVYVGGVVIINVDDVGAQGTTPYTFIVPNGLTYSVTVNSNTIRQWAELR